MSVSASVNPQCQFSGSLGTWTSVVADWRRSVPGRLVYGIQGDSPTDRIAQTGVLEVALDNSQGNSVGRLGYYAPDSSSPRAGFETGTPIRQAITYSGSTFYKFVGRIDSIEPLGGKYAERHTRVTATDFFEEMAKFRLRLLDVQVNKRADENIATVVGAMTIKPSASSLAIGQDTFPTSLDTAKDETTSAYSERAKSVMSELGYCYIVGDTATGGVLTFDDRHTRPKTTTTSASVNDTMVGIRAERARAGIFNRVKVTSHPREVSSASQILYTLQSKPLVQAGASLIMTGMYTDPDQRGIARVGGASMITPTSPCDYQMNAASAGDSTCMATGFTVSTSYGGNSVRYSIYNGNSTPGYVTKLQARGIGIYDREPTVSEQSDATSIAAYGEAVLELDMPYQGSVLVSDDAAHYLLSTLKDPLTHLSQVEFIGNRSDALMKAGLQTEPGDRVRIQETATGINKDYFVNGCEIDLPEDGTIHFLWTVAPAATTQYWILGVAGFSELDTTTRLGY